MKDERGERRERRGESGSERERGHIPRLYHYHCVIFPVMARLQPLRNIQKPYPPMHSHEADTVNPKPVLAGEPLAPVSNSGGFGVQGCAKVTVLWVM